MDLHQLSQEELIDEIRRLRHLLETSSENISEVDHSLPTDNHRLFEIYNRNLHDYFDNASDLIQVFSPDEEILFVNAAWKKILGYTEVDLEKKRFSDLVHPSYKETVQSLLKKASKGNKSDKTDIIFISKNGREKHVSGSFNCNFEDGKPVAYTGIFYDNTEWIRAENAQRLYNSIADLSIQSDNLEELLEHIHILLKDQIAANNFHVALYDPVKNYFNFPYYVDEVFGGKVNGYGREFTKGLTEYTFTHKKPIFLYEEDIDNLVASNQVNPYEHIPKIWLGVPLMIDKRVTGVIAVKSHSDRNKYKRSDLELLDFISGQIALVIERKRYEDQINENQAHLNAIFESSSHLIWSINKHGGLTSFNHNYANAFFLQYGYYPVIDNSGSQPLLQLSSSEDPKHVQNIFDSAFKGEEQHLESKITLSNNKTIWLETFLNPIYLSDGRIEEISGISHDITEKKQSELDIQENEEKFRNIFESFQDIYFRVNTVGIITLVSPSAFELAGYLPEEVIGRPIADFFESIKHQESLIKKLLEEGSVTNFEVNVLCKNGQHFPAIANIRLIETNSNEKVYDGVLRDISVLKKASVEIIQAKELAERSLKIKERFLANMSHEIRTPMNGIISMIDMLKETQLNEEQFDYVTTIKQSSHLLLDIVNDILDLSKLEAGKMELRSEPVSVLSTLDRLCSMYQQHATNKGLSLNYQLNTDIPSYILADETRLMQILSNLTLNAIKFTEEGKININAYMTEHSGNDVTIRFDISDTGIGISEEQIGQLFKSFNQLDNSITKTYQGTGLGLSISKELVKMMHGEIGVISNTDKGSTFWFTIKTVSTDSRPVENKVKKSKANKQYFKLNTPRILLVDDNQVNQRVGSVILRKAGCLVDIASNGLEAIEMVRTQARYDIIFMDIQMPHMDGITATTELKKMNIADLPPIVAMTAYAMKEDEERLLKAGLDHYIAKPITPEVLIGKVRTIMSPDGKQIYKEPSEDAEKAKKIIIDPVIIHQLESLGGKNILKEIYGEFDTETSGIISICQELVTKRSFQELKSHLHFIKGSAGTLGVVKVAKHSEKLEKQLKNENYTTFISDFEKLELAFEEYQKKYRKILNLNE